MHWKLTLSYDGSNFHGWQVQPGRATVQGALADALHQLTGETVLPQGSGRTDAGVHALAQVASFSLVAPIPAENLQRALNRALPPSIRVLTTEAMPDSFHARYAARRKIYEYRIFGGGAICSPFLSRYVWDCPWKLDVTPMQKAAGMLVGTYDFTSFAAIDPDLTTRNGDGELAANTRTVFSSEIRVEDHLILYRVSGSGFLHHMVRNIVGTLVEVGRGALTAEDLPGILAARERSAAGPTAPPQGLFLVSVDYGEGQ